MSGVKVLKANAQPSLLALVSVKSFARREREGERERALRVTSLRGLKTR